MLLLGHEEIREFPHRPLCIGDGLLHNSDAALRLFDRPLKGLALFRDDHETLLADPLNSSFAGCPDQAPARSFDQMLERRNQLVPVPTRAPMSKLFRRADLEQRPDRMLESLF